MQRISGEFLDKIELLIPLENCDVFEIGCGDGATSIGMALRCKQLTAIDPSAEKIERAKARDIVNAIFFVGSAEKLDFPDHEYDLVVFTLSFHHVPISRMNRAISEAVRVVKKMDYIIFLEPTEEGSIFNAEIMFDAWDGDERKNKRAAYKAMHMDKSIALISEFEDETVFIFESVSDFIQTMEPKKNLSKLDKFLFDHGHTLRAKRRVSIFQAVEGISF